jgi:hypothetical protein
MALLGSPVIGAVHVAVEDRLQLSSRVSKQEPGAVPFDTEVLIEERAV